jgi:hypothetical protein
LEPEQSIAEGRGTDAVETQSADETRETDAEYAEAQTYKLEDVEELEAVEEEIEELEGFPPDR